MVRVAKACAVVVVAVGVAMLLALPGGLPPAGAAGTNEFSIAPAGAGANARALFTYTLAPGQTITDRATIANYGASNLNVNVYSADAYNVPDDGAFALRQQADPKAGVGSWVKLPVENVNVGAKEQVTFPFTLTVPQDAQPGDAAGGIVALDTSQSTAQQGPVAIGVNKAVGVRIYVRVKGPARPALSVPDLSIDTAHLTMWPAGGKQQAHIHYSVENSGNIRLSPTAVVTVTDLWGSTVKRYPPHKFAELLPGQKADVVLPWRDVPELGLRYTAIVVVTAAHVHETREVSTLVIPWLLVVLLVLIVAGILWWWWHRRRLRAAAIEPSVERSARQEASAPAAVGATRESTDERPITWQAP
jgi:hypothetical protein